MDRIPIGEQPEDTDNVVRLPTGEPADAGEADMSYEEAIAADAVEETDDVRSEPSPGSQVAELMGQGVKVGAGLFAAGATALADALRATAPPEPERGTDPAATLAGAGLGAAVTAAEAAAGAATQVADTIGPALTWLFEPRFAKDATEVAAGAARVLDGQWKASQAEMVAAATTFLHELVPEIARGLADQVDLTALVRERVDLNAIVDDVDIERILDRVDVDALAERIDVNAIVERVDMEGLAREFPVETVVESLDVNAVVDRVDVDRVIARTDLLAVVERLDVSAIAQEVIEDVDLPRVIRESSGALAGETVRSARVQSMNADRLVARIVDRVLRREARDLSAPPPRGPS